VIHVNGPTDDGWFVIDFWTSKEDRDDFLEHRVKPAVEQAGLSGIEGGIADLELHNSLRAMTARAHA
jgi:hypothetical protein